MRTLDPGDKKSVPRHCDVRVAVQSLRHIAHYLQVILLWCNDMDVLKSRRLDEFLKRLRAAPAACNAKEALELVADTLNAVEDEMTSIPYNSAGWMTDGRMYPPQADSARVVSEELTRYRSRGHNTLIHVSGAIRLEETGGTCLLNKPAQNGYLIQTTASAPSPSMNSSVS